MKSDQEGFHGGSVVKNPPANAGDMGSIPGPGGSHVRSPHTPTREKPMQQQRPSTAKNKFFFFKKSDQERSADSDGGRQCRLTHTCMHTCTHTCTHVCTHTHTRVHTHAPISEQGAMQFDPKAERCYQRCPRRWAGPLWPGCSPNGPSCHGAPHQRAPSSGSAGCPSRPWSRLGSASSP